MVGRFIKIMIEFCFDFFVKSVEIYVENFHCLIARTEFKMVSFLSMASYPVGRNPGFGETVSFLDLARNRRCHNILFFMFYVQNQRWGAVHFSGIVWFASGRMWWVLRMLRLHDTLENHRRVEPNCHTRSITTRRKKFIPWIVSFLYLAHSSP